jgi:phosphoribulokinase
VPAVEYVHGLHGGIVAADFNLAINSLAYALDVDALVGLEYIDPIY